MPSNPRARRARAIALVAALAASSPAAVPARVAAQTPAPLPLHEPQASVSDHAAVLAVNVALAGLTAGVRQWRSGGSFLDGLWRGGLGGAGTYAGKLIVTADAPGAGFAGRAVAAAGASVSRNASDGLPSFHRLVIPAGFVRMHWEPAAGNFHTSIDVTGAGAVVGSYLAGMGASLDMRRTLSSGAPVFMAREWESNWGWHARHVAGTIVLRGDSPDDIRHDRFIARALAHEQVHVIQYDQAWILWSEPVERRALKALGASPLLVRSVDLSLHAGVLLGLNALIPYAARPWEREADILSGTDRHTYPTGGRRNDL
ncbi:MAG TPA: hypothetical protein VK936_03745 [Longimicrobiales bacterium]|nr:hypothetical protein [Longimicrobiales bacterium]